MRISKHLLFFLAVFVGSFFVLPAHRAHAFAGGTGTSGSPYQVTTVADLASIGTSYTGAAGSGKYFKLMNDIDLNVASYNSGSGWSPIGTSGSMFQGNFDGNGKVISNLYINRSGTTGVGLFGYVSAGSIHDLGVTNVNVTGNDYTGGLIGYYSSSGTVSTVYATGTVSGGGSNGGVGGVIGWCNSGAGTITTSYSTATITGTARSGGLVGYAYCPITSSYSTGNVTVTSTPSWTGGLTGVNAGGITNSFATGNVTGGNNVSSIGGLVGGNFNSITNAYSTGLITVGTGTSNIGGMVGNQSSGTVTASYWNTTTSGKATSAAGTGKTTSEMTTQSTFSGWDFSTVWGISSLVNSGYPYLRWTNPVTTYTLTYTAGAHGSITGTTPQTVNSGADGSAVTAVADTGYHFTSWSDASTANPRTDTAVAANVSVTANFAINTYTFSYSAGSGGMLSGTSSQTVNYGADGSAVTAVPDSGYVFTSWSDASTANPRTDTNASANISVTASFSDSTAPQITDLSTSVSGTTVSISWTSSEVGSSRISYGPTISYESSTSETDTSPRVTSHTQTLTGLNRCQVYYYRVASKDAAGNEGVQSGGTFRTGLCSAPARGGLFSTQNSTPIVSNSTPASTTSAAPVHSQVIAKTSVLQGFAFKKDMKYRNSFNDVAMLQEFLKTQGSDIYPEGVVNGYFGPATKRAVIRFQEKYKNEILAPIGEESGTGIVSTYTRKKINELLSTSTGYSNQVS